MTDASGFALARLGWRGWFLMALVIAMAIMGLAMQYSVAGDPATYSSATDWWRRGSWDPWASRHATRLAVGVVIMLALALIPLAFWRALAYPAYIGALALLVGVEVAGEEGGGATRWLALGPLRIQPSELMKLALVLGVARYYQGLEQRDMSSVLAHVPPLIMLALPAALIVRQPDLGTALLVAATGAILIFLAGMPWRAILGAGALGLVGLVLLFTYGLHDYQRARILTFFDPSADPMGAGYHSLQSKIAIGSGGLTGKGFGAGTQTQLGFLPEKHTDFIFTVIGEEMGFYGGMFILVLAAAICALCVSIAVSARSPFGRLAASGVAATFVLYVFINVAMVMGLAPVVGVPLPLVSYGGTVMLAVMAGFGVVLSVQANRDVELHQSRSILV